MNITVDPPVSPNASTAAWVDQLFWWGNCGRFQQFAYKIKAFRLQESPKQNFAYKIKASIQDKSLSPSGVSKTKLNIYISSLHLYFGLFCFDCALLPKEKRKSRERKRKNRQDVLTLLFAFSLLLSSQLMLSGCVCVFFFYFCHFLLVFNLLLVLK